MSNPSSYAMNVKFHRYNTGKSMKVSLRRGRLARAGRRALEADWFLRWAMSAVKERALAKGC